LEDAEPRDVAMRPLLSSHPHPVFGHHATMVAIEQVKTLAAEHICAARFSTSGAMVDDMYDADVFGRARSTISPMNGIKLFCGYNCGY
jgi:hypothetical protein